MKKLVLYFLVIIFTFLLSYWLFSYLDKSDEIHLNIKRFDKSLFSITQESVEFDIANWDTLFGSFNEVFASNIMHISHLSENQYASELLSFVNNNNMREAYDSTALLFSDLSFLEYDLGKAFSNFSAIFPSYPLPEITTFFGGFNYGVVTYDSNIAIGLENFLGQYSKFYTLLGDPSYLRFQKQKKFILPNVMEAWYNEHFEKQNGGKDFLSQIIYKGKMMYFLDQVIPFIPLADKFRFTNCQMKWVQDSEASIWEYLVQEDLLFSRKESDFRSFVSYAPFTKGLPKEAPDRVGYYVGYQMVKSYMNHNDIAFNDLVFLTESREFLKKSKYKPRK